VGLARGRVTRPIRPATREHQYHDGRCDPGR
jgi:hypothetical protein